MTITIKFEDENGDTKYAFYGHLSEISVKSGDQIKEGDAIGKTGNTGNAYNMKGEDEHLHFEYRTQEKCGKGLAGRLDPNEVVDTKFQIDSNNKTKVIQVPATEKPQTNDQQTN
jgi:murein DD-endopeptidase MepM/ murein hydrolase activator NlpD